MQHNSSMSRDWDNDKPPNDVVRVPFHGRIIHTTMGLDGEPAVVLKPTIEAMGLDYSAQLKKLKIRSWATVAETATVAEDGKTRVMATINLETWSMLLANIDENRVSLDAQPLVIAYQKESAKALRDYWTQGVAVNPRYSPAEQAAVLAALSGVVDAGWLDAKGRQLAGRVLGEAPEFDQASKPLTVATYLTEQGVKAAEQRKIAGQFGKALKAKYVAAHGAEPPTIEDLVGRHMIPVAQYQERHRPLFDAVWRGLNREGGGSNRPRGRRK